MLGKERTMTAQADASAAALPQNEQVGEVTTLRQGAVAGVLGAAMIALWFFVLDVGSSRWLYTPTLLGTALFYGSAALPNDVTTLAGSVGVTLMFSVVHGAVFILMGVATARLLNLLAQRP